MAKVSRDKAIQKIYQSVMNGNEEAFRDLMRLWQIDPHLVNESHGIAEIMADIFFCRYLPVAWKEEMWNLRNNAVCYEYQTWTVFEYANNDPDDDEGTEVEKEGYVSVSFKEYILKDSRYLEVLRLYGYI